MRRREIWFLIAVTACKGGGGGPSVDGGEGVGDASAPDGGVRCPASQIVMIGASDREAHPISRDTPSDAADRARATPPCLRPVGRTCYR
jgi:hypothetical protein